MSRFVVTLLLIAYSSFSQAGATTNTYSSPASKIAQEQGFKELSEPIVLIRPKKIPSDWKALDNKFFKIAYPDCYLPVGEEGESDIKKTGALLLSRQKTCSEFDSSLEGNNSLGIALASFGYKKLESISVANMLLRQKMKINDQDAVFIVSVFNHFDHLTEKTEVQLRFQVFPVCRSQTYDITFDMPPGEKSIQLFNKKVFQIPEDYKKVISYFRCPK